MADILVYATSADGVVDDVSLQAITLGRRLAAGGEVHVVVAGDEAVASSLAGTQQLGNLVVLYDDNRISIEGNTALAFTEDVCERYRAYGWHTIHVDQNADGSVDVPALWTALQAGAAETRRPTLISVRTTITWPAPHLRGSEKSHGSALGEDEIRALERLHQELFPQTLTDFSATILNDDEELRLRASTSIGKIVEARLHRMLPYHRMAVATFVSGPTGQRTMSPADAR